MLTEPIAVTLLVVNILDDLAIPYFIGGSLATAVHGIARATMDVDLIADIRPEHVHPFVQALGPAFYADDEMMRRAIQHQSSFNIIHQETMFKVDIFVHKKRPFEQAQFARRVSHPLTDDPAQFAYVASPEDIILAKLEWYRMGGEISDRQWNDIINVLKIQGERLDRGYMDEWAVQLGVHDLLVKAWQEI